MTSLIYTWNELNDVGYRCVLPTSLQQLIVAAPEQRTLPPNNSMSSLSNSEGEETKPSIPADSGADARAQLESSRDALDLREAAQSFQERNGQHHPIAEFLYQLTKMLTDDNNEIIEWADGRIRVHRPELLESEVLHKYFRHSKFASFQRQLNYFGFRKIAGKGKMSPCSYVNDAATSDIRSLLLIKRKTNGSAARKAAMQQRMQAEALNPLAMNLQALGGQLSTVLNGQALNNAMAVLQENARRSGIQMQIPQQNTNAQQPNQNFANLFAFQNQLNQPQQQMLAQQQMQFQQQLMQQQQQQQQQQPSQQLLQQSQEQVTAPKQPDQPQSLNQPQVQASNGNGAPSLAPAPVGGAPGATIEQLQAQLAALTNQQLNRNLPNPATAALNLSSMTQRSGTGAAPLNQATLALTALMQQSNPNPASAALNAQNMPASNAAASSVSNDAASLFDSAANLKSLLNEHAQNAESTGTQNGSNTSVADMASQVLLNRLPSSNSIFNEANNPASALSLINSSHRLSSLLSLNSLGREASLADLATVAATSGIAAPMSAAPTTNAPQDGSAPS